VGRNSRPKSSAESDDLPTGPDLKNGKEILKNYPAQLAVVKSLVRRRRRGRSHLSVLSGTRCANSNAETQASAKRIGFASSEFVRCWEDPSPLNVGLRQVQRKDSPKFPAGQEPGPADHTVPRQCITDSWCLHTSRRHQVRRSPSRRLYPRVGHLSPAPAIDPTPIQQYGLLVAMAVVDAHSYCGVDAPTVASVAEYWQSMTRRYEMQEREPAGARCGRHVFWLYRGRGDHPYNACRFS